MRKRISQRRPTEARLRITNSRGHATLAHLSSEDPRVRVECRRDDRFSGAGVVPDPKNQLAVRRRLVELWMLQKVAQHLFTRAENTATAIRGTRRATLVMRQWIGPLVGATRVT